MVKRNTKENILNESINLFAQKGYNAVSVREIASAVGIKESSIYNHYQSKQEILDTIFIYLTEEMTPDSETDQQTNKLISQNLEQFYKVGSNYYREKLKNPKIVKIFRILFIELYHNNTVKHYMKNIILEAPIQAWIELFTKMMETGQIKKTNPERLAKLYFLSGMEQLFEIFLIHYPNNTEERLKIFFDEMEINMHFLLQPYLLK
jgi:AcrR family transcriptional regulator